MDKKLVITLLVVGVLGYGYAFSFYYYPSVICSPTIGVGFGDCTTDAGFAPIIIAFWTSICLLIILGVARIGNSFRKNKSNDTGK